MDLQSIKYFITVAKMEHLTHAADMLNISQPALSNAIARLENELGFLLFDRVGRNIRLSQEGQAFLPFAASATENIDNGIHAAEKILDIKKQRVTIHSTPMSSFPGLLDSIFDVCPIAQINTTMVSADFMVEQLLSHELDLWITTDHVTNKTLYSKVLATEEICVVMPKTHPLAQKSSLCLSELKEQTFISLTQIGFFYDAIQLIGKSGGFTPKISHYVSSIKDLITFLSAGHTCISVTSLHATDYFSDTSLCCLPFHDASLKIDRKLYWRRQNNNSAVIKAKNAIIDYFRRQRAP